MISASTLGICEIVLKYIHCSNERVNGPSSAATLFLQLSNRRLSCVILMNQQAGVVGFVSKWVVVKRHSCCFRKRIPHYSGNDAVGCQRFAIYMRCESEGKSAHHDLTTCMDVNTRTEWLSLDAKSRKGIVTVGGRTFRFI